MTYNDTQITLSRIHSFCTICNDDREHCPQSKAKHKRGTWVEGDALISLGEKLGRPPYVGRHRRGRHAA